MGAGTCGVKSTPGSLTPTVIVIGAGFGGLAAARFLHNSNLKVRLWRRFI
jgi:cation diffusion facilitator CzcD-associated flavoprotein CzcO